MLRQKHSLAKTIPMYRICYSGFTELNCENHNIPHCKSCSQILTRKTVIDVSTGCPQISVPPLLLVLFPPSLSHQSSRNGHAPRRDKGWRAIKRNSRRSPWGVQDSSDTRLYSKLPGVQGRCHSRIERLITEHSKWATGGLRRKYN